MAARGGKRPGSGRKPVAAEAETRIIATKAITDTFGTKEEAFKWLIASGEAALIKFAFAHAFGNPVDNVNLSGEIKVKQITGIVVK